MPLEQSLNKANSPNSAMKNVFIYEALVHVSDVER